MRDSDLAYEKIKEKIITAELMPGEVVIENQIMKELDMGRTPVREALNRLSWEKQVRIIPRQCILVSELPNRELESVFQIRYTLSSLEGELVAKKRTDDDMKELEQIVDAFEQEQDARKRVILDRQFHRCISHITKNTYLENEMNVMMDLSIRLIFLNRERLDTVDTNTVEEHREIIQAIREKDGSRTSRLLQEHVLSFREKFML